MEHQMMLQKVDLPGYWGPLPPTQAKSTRSDTIPAQELGALKRAQEEEWKTRRRSPRNCAE